MAELPPTEDSVSPLPDAGLTTSNPDTAPVAAAPDAGPEAPTRAGSSPPTPTAHTRTSGTWIGVIIAAVVLTLLLVFILQNTRSATISFFTVKGAMPLGVALLLAALAGIFLAAVVGSLRILQIRRRLNATAGGGARRRRGRHATGVAESGLG